MECQADSLECENLQAQSSPGAAENDIDMTDQAETRILSDPITVDPSTNPDEEEVDLLTTVPFWCSCRFALAFVGFLGFVNVYALRVNMSVAIVCMVNQTAIKGAAEENMTMVEDNHCPAVANSTKLKDGEFLWDKELQGIILGSFFWGYLLTQIMGGWLAGRFGGKRIFGYSMLTTAVATLLCPIGAQGSPYLLMALRFITGLGEGVAFPAMHAVWSKWAPPLERSKLIGFTFAGAQIGNVITLPLSGLLCDKGFAGGWPSIFYVFGMFGVVWFILWIVLTHDSPADHPRISKLEHRYIEQSIGATKKSPITSTPWKDILLSKPIWAIIIGHTFANWGTYTLLTNIPAYMREVLKFDIKSNGLFSAIPYIVFWAVISVGGIIADKIRSVYANITTKVVRKIMYSLGTLLPAAFLVGTGYITCENQYAGVAILTIAVGASGFQYPGVMVNHADIAPPFAGILFGISNTAATLSGILAPYAIGRITTDQTQEQWRVVFYISAAIYIAGAIFFCIFADGEIQEWAKPYMYEDERDPEEEGLQDDAVNNDKKGDRNESIGL